MEFNLSSEAKVLREQFEGLLNEDQLFLMDCELMDDAYSLGLNEEDTRWEFAVKMQKSIKETIQQGGHVSLLAFYTGKRYLPEVIVEKFIAESN